jgi:predicted ABC-type transport system involved in lysophospholipase L1 biosynthesis ATPase subunit
MLGRVGLGERLRHYPKVLSGGEQQRVALARAFVVQPAVLLGRRADRQPRFRDRRTVMDLMFELNREAGTTLGAGDRTTARSRRAATASCGSRPAASSRVCRTVGRGSKPQPA